MPTSKDNPDIEKVWEQFRFGNKEAMEQLAALFYRSLYNYGLKLSQDSEMVQDGIQELFLELWTRGRKLPNTPFVKTYLLRALRNKIVKESLRLKRIREAEDLAFYARHEPSIESKWMENESEREQIERLKLLISGLAKRQQEVIYLRFYQNQSQEEIAHIMNLNKQSVANLLHRTLSDLRNRWPQVIFALWSWSQLKLHPTTL
ncbi:RNA polymerase sigma factor [Dyadobacter tibetensis]|uniref:RNA polymerase sigma factor n=1 Tax=Dyadobacter tibetensis TaxID=1211851 RepID=UPI0004703042|nr:sigma-70 family RNA polymerase sigma factor [Dyadobacter tibetensis]